MNFKVMFRSQWMLCGLVLITFQIIDVTSGGICSDFESCGDCIGSPNACVWCPAEQHTGPRCVSESAYRGNSSWCIALVENPKTEYEIDKSEDFKNIKNGGKDTVQFKPQHMNLKVRVGVATSFNILYKPAEDYPIDVYYLIDNSYTMKQHKDKLGDQAQKIYESLISLTNNVRFGMGSFVDKCALPYANPLEKNPAYSFKNHIPLTENIAEFGKMVKLVSPVGNYDDLEGGLDALMQVMLCFEGINWRRGARRMIILSTDAPYHSAGDGKIVGAYKHNPMECHLDHNGANGSYMLNYSLLYDYPSVSQINKAAKDGKFTILFAVLRQVKDVYEALADKIEGAKFVELSTNSNIVDMITTEYKKLTQKLKISIEPPLPPHIKLSLDPPCSLTNPCSVQHRETRSIKVSLNVTECSRDNNYSIKLGPQDLAERLTMDLHVYCKCNCEKNAVVKSPKCKEHGQYRCGVCNCDKGRFGEQCECKGNLTPETVKQSCKFNKNDVHECSGRGKCSCGKCTCESGFSGPLCQYSEFSCPYRFGRPCAGRGRCVAGDSCACDPGWSGPDCSCTLDSKPCIAPKSNKVCSGNGFCECGQCHCTAVDSKNNTYTGAFCEYCEGCAEARCVELGEFVECYYNAIETNATIIEACKETFTITDAYLIAVLNRTELNALRWKNAHRCKRLLLDGSFVVFKYFDEENGTTTLLIQKDKEIPTKANVWVAVGISIGTILLVGLLTAIAWKILVDIHDTREYNKFAKQAAAEGFIVSENPLYHSPAVKFENPTYRSEL